jgi:hypothetical protein
MSSVMVVLIGFGRSSVRRYSRRQHKVQQQSPQRVPRVEPTKIQEAGFGCRVLAAFGCRVLHNPLSAPETTMSQTRQEQVAAAVKAIRAFHELGRSLPVKASHKNGYGQGTVEAEKHGLNPDTVRKARQFADPVSGYTVAEANALCRSIRDMQEEQDGPVFGRTHLIRLLSVPKKQRAKVQTAAIENGWSTADLEAHIATRFGSRRDGGRKRRVPSDLPGLLVQLEGLCEGWRRWAEVVVGDEDDQQRKGRKRVELPTELFQSVLAATKAITDLHDEVTRELQTRRPKRGVRKRFRGDGDSHS